MTKSAKSNHAMVPKLDIAVLRVVNRRLKWFLFGLNGCCGYSAKVTGDYFKPVVPSRD